MLETTGEYRIDQNRGRQESGGSLVEWARTLLLFETGYVPVVIPPGCL